MSKTKYQKKYESKLINIRASFNPENAEDNQALEQLQEIKDILNIKNSKPALIKVINLAYDYLKDKK